MKKFLALMIAAMLVLTSMSVAFAAANTAKTLDPHVEITGLDEGDVVNFYKVVGWNQDSGWVLDDTFSGLATSGIKEGTVVGWASPADPEGIKTDVLKYITGYVDEPTISYDSNGNASVTYGTSVKGRINSDLAAVIASIVTGTTADHTETVGTGATSVKWEQTTGANAHAAPEAGLYVALVSPAKVDTIYNPIFVAADYDQTNPADQGQGDTYFTNSWAVDMDDSYSDTAMAKKKTIDVKKQIITDPDTGDIASSSTEGEGGTATSVDAGEVLQFKVTTTIPEYSNLYTWAKFDVTDTLNGLKLKIDSAHKFEIKAGTATISADDGLGGPKKDGDFTNTAVDGGATYTISFDDDYILGLSAATNIEITYWATVTGDVTKVINPTDNKVKVEFSNNPNSNTDYSTLIDRTNQYSFSIDANINGLQGKTSSELIKIGVDKDGKPLVEKKEYDNGLTEIPALQGATFVLLTSNANISSLVGKNKSELEAYTGTGASDIYSNTLADGTVVKAIVDSSEKGYLTFNGLDKGTYYLVETKAPDGFVRSTTVYTITITPTYEEKTYTEVIGNKTVSCKAEVLTKYTVAVSDGTTTQTSEYTTILGTDNTAGSMDFTNISNHVENDANYDVKADHSTLIANTQGVELPSTGGMGTTLFYIGGGLLALIAVVLLVTKRRMSSND